MKNGHTQKLPDEVRVVLTEGDVEVCVTYAETQEAADKMLADWKNGTLRLLAE